MSEDTQYPLSRGTQQISRVGIWQLIWYDVLGFLTHPKIAQEVNKVADVATATGVWLCELNKSRPGYEVLDGFDVSSASFIRPHALADGVSLYVADATKPVPEEFRAKYDLVHMRLVIPNILDNDPSAFIEHCKQLLKPGGYLQWEEVDPLDAQVDIPAGIARPSKVEELAQVLLDHAPKSWVHDIPIILKEHDMDIVTIDRKRQSIWYRNVATILVCDVWNEYASAFLDVAGPPGSGDEMRSRTMGALSEVTQGATMSLLYQCVVAQKPK